ncbi:MAG: S24/S26 family peptidase [Desulfobacterales bacterium]|nr:S24/S26 family peptidase [Desulfobacterales bacterium]
MSPFRQETLPGKNPFTSDSGLGELLSAVMAKGGYFRFKARGTSMHPFIRDGDVITLSAVTAGTGLHVGDIAAVLHPVSGKLIVHRVIRKRGTRVQTKGDNSKLADESVPVSAVLGRVSQVRRGGSNCYNRTKIKDLLAAWFSRLGLLPGRLSVFFHP